MRLAPPPASPARTGRRTRVRAPGSQRELPAVAPHVPELDQRQQESPGRGPGQPGRPATSLKLSRSRSGPNALITASPRSSDCTKSRIPGGRGIPPPRPRFPSARSSPVPPDNLAAEGSASRRWCSLCARRFSSQQHGNARERNPASARRRPQVRGYAPRRTPSGGDTVARCAAPRTTRSREPAIPSAIRAPCSGGVDGSRFPPRPRPARRSAPGRPADPCRRSPRSTPRTHPSRHLAARRRTATITASSRLVNAGVNHLASDASRIGAIPEDSTRPARSNHPSAGGRYADVQTTAHSADPVRSVRGQPTSRALPPRETPARPQARRRAGRASRACFTRGHRPNWARAAKAAPPCPGNSNRRSP